MVQSIVFNCPNGAQTIYSANMVHSTTAVHDRKFADLVVKELTDLFVSLELLQHDYKIDICITPRNTVSVKDEMVFQLLDSVLKNNRNLLAVVRHIAERKIFPEACALEKLSPMQRKIAGLVRLGLSYTEIAKKLSISPHTVNGHRKNAMKVLGVSSVLEMSAYLERFNA